MTNDTTAVDGAMNADDNMAADANMTMNGEHEHSNDMNTTANNTTMNNAM